MTKSWETEEILNRVVENSPNFFRKIWKFSIKIPIKILRIKFKANLRHFWGYFENVVIIGKIRRKFEEHLRKF